MGKNDLIFRGDRVKTVNVLSYDLKMHLEL